MSNFATFVERWAAQRPEHVAIRYRDEAITYRELQARVERATVRLAALGVNAGDRVAWLGLNHPELLAGLFALARLGAILVPLNFRLATPEHRALLEHAGAEYLVIDADFTAAGEALGREFPLMKRIALGPAPAGWFAWRGDAPTGFTPKLRGTWASPLMLVYTSGTTGKPKGALHSQEGMLWNIVCATHCQDFTAADVVLMPLPMFHVGGLCIQTLPVLHAGGTVIVQPRFDPGAWLEDVARCRPSASLLVPATVRAVLDHPRWPSADLASLRLVNMGSSVVPNNLIQAFIDRGVTVVQVYGATETGPVSIVLRPEDARRKVGSAGLPALHVDVRLIGADGREVAPGDVGEITVRAQNMMTGYWKDPDNPAFRDGWFRTGDLARVDADGYYWIAGRSKDMIISGGENIYPAEIENIFAESPEIVECAVVGRPDPKWGETAVAVIVLKAGSTLDERAVLAMLEGRIARYKHPRRIVFAESLPKTALGKVQKAELGAWLEGR
jgi:fatty-acyl-CoA synthase